MRHHGDFGACVNLLQTCHAELAELAASLQTCNARFTASLLPVKIAIWVDASIEIEFKWKTDIIPWRSHSSLIICVGCLNVFL